MNTARTQLVFAALYLAALFLGTGFIHSLEAAWR